MGNLRHEGVVWVRVGEHGADTEQHCAFASAKHVRGRGLGRRLTFGDCQGGRPLVPQDVETDGTVRVDVGVIDSRGEVDLWRLEGVVCREVYREEEDTARVRTVPWTHNGGLPVEQVVTARSGGAGGRRVFRGQRRGLASLHARREGRIVRGSTVGGVSSDAWYARTPLHSLSPR